MTTQNIITALDQKIAETEKELEKLRHAAELLPKVDTNLLALKRTRALLLGSDPDELGPKENGSSGIHSQSGSIGSVALEVLREIGPLHVDDLLPRLESRGIKTNKNTLAGTLVRYKKMGKVKRTKPNTFAVV